MRITSADIYDIILPESRQWNLVVLRLNTDEGIYGLGEVALAYGTGAKAAIGMLEQMVPRFVLGADPSRIEEMWQRLYRRTFWGQGGGPVVYGAMSAIDEALWDIKGKALGVPVYELLGGKVRDSIRAYSNGWYVANPDKYGINRVPEDFRQRAIDTVALGYTALKLDPFELYDGSGFAYPDENPSAQRLATAVQRMAVTRDAVGPDVDLLIEVHGALGTAVAIEMGRRFAEFKPMFYEEPVDTMNMACLRQVHDQQPIPIAAGERLYTRHGFRPYIEAQAIDILQPDLGLAGGISEVRKIAAHAETYKLHMQPHLCAGPVAAAATLQLDAAMPNFLIQEWFTFHIAPFYQLFEQDCPQVDEDGMLAIPEGPGLGITLDEAHIASHGRMHLEA